MLEIPIESVQRCLNPLFQRTIFMMFIFFSKKNPQVRTNNMVNSVAYLPCTSQLATSIHLFIFL